MEVTNEYKSWMYQENRKRYDAYRKMFIYPQDPRDYEILASVDRQTRGIVADNFDILLDYDWMANTIANCYLETLIQTLGGILQKDPRSGLGIDFFGILRIISTIKWNSSAEKEGNINIVFEVGPKAEEIIAKGPMDEVVHTKIKPNIRFATEDKNDSSLYENIEWHAKYTLLSAHGVGFGENMNMSITAVAYTFIECLFRELVFRASALGDGEMVSVNFNDNIEAHATKKGEEVFIYLRPGMSAKLLIKMDAITEDTMGSDNDDD